MRAPLGCVTGRFQPVHDQHLELITVALEVCDHVIVAVTNPDAGARHEEPTSAHRHTPDANPFTYYERTRLLTAALAGAGLAARTTVVPFDLTRPHVWPDYVPRSAVQFVRAYDTWERHKAAALESGGYTVTVLDGDPAAKRSASDIRGLLRDGGRWGQAVPAGVAPLLRDMLRAVPMVARS